MASIQLARRRFNFAAAGAVAGWALPSRSQERAPFLADMHSHIGQFVRRPVEFNLREHMRETGATLLAWSVTDDNRWIAPGRGGYRQTREPQPGELWDAFQRRLAGYEARLQGWGLAKALTPADVDAAMAGEPRVLLAIEAANFLEGQPERVAQAHGWGVRHMQLVHYINSPLGDHQTAVPRHGGLTALGAAVIAQCARHGIVVDLAHGTAALVDAALDASDSAMVWSHSWISPQGGTWQDPGYLARSLSPASARKIAGRGGAVGLWALRVGAATYAVRDVTTFADETIRMCDLIGPEHVAFGTDMEGVGSRPILSDYIDLRAVADELGKRGLSEAVLRQIFIGNYARIVKQAMNSAAGKDAT